MSPRKKKINIVNMILEFCAENDFKIIEFKRGPDGHVFFQKGKNYRDISGIQLDMMLSELNRKEELELKRLL